MGHRGKITHREKGHLQKEKRERERAIHRVTF